jgi:hypothetical protein
MERINGWIMAMVLVFVVAVSALTVQAASLPIAGATASTFIGNNGPEDAIDGVFNTRWETREIGGWLALDLGTCGIVQSLQIDWSSGENRQYNFAVEASDDGTAWTPIFSGMSDGVTVTYESVDVTDIHACFVRVIGYGNTHANANTAMQTRIVEILVDGEPDVVPVIEVPLAALDAICTPWLAAQQ